MTKLLLDATSTRAADLAPPRSKSDAQRALALAHGLADPDLAPISLREPDLAADIVALGRGLERLRTAPADPAPVHVGDGGAPLRILLGQIAITPGARMRVTGSPRLAERPHGALIDALRATLGTGRLVLEPHATDYFPITVHGADRVAEPTFRIRAAESSQFATSLLLAAAALAAREGRAWAVELDGPAASEGYLDLTLHWMERAGVSVQRSGPRLEVSPTRGPVRRGPVPGDWSSLGYLLPIAWRTGGRATWVDLDVAHPDRFIVDVLRQAGLTVTVDDHGNASVSGQARGGVHASGQVCPDLLPTIAVLACVLPAPSTLADVSILKLKESDRLAGIGHLVTAAGGRVVALPDDAIRIEPGTPPTVLALHSRGDHRLAMCAATLAVLTGARLHLEEAQVVEKSFPGFYRELTKAGVTVSE